MCKYRLNSPSPPFSPSLLAALWQHLYTLTEVGFSARSQDHMEFSKLIFFLSYVVANPHLDFT